MAARAWMAIGEQAGIDSRMIGEPQRNQRHVRIALRTGGADRDIV